ncbi:MAG TPA: MFS transporter [Clostridiaceae bacterium]|nr:MFS transporter [Clostridiaceae bacterium]
MEKFPQERVALVARKFKEKLFGHSHHERICSGEHRISQILFLIDAVLINAAYVLTTGIFLSGFIINLEGSDYIVALLNNAAIWATILSVFSFLILERIKKRKNFLIAINLMARILISGIVFVPLLIDRPSLTISIIAIMVIISHVLWGVYQLGWMIWYMEIAPEKKKNDYVYLRMFFVRIAFTVSTLVMGYVLDYYNKSYKGFLIVYITALVLSVIDVIVLVFIKEPEYKAPQDGVSIKNMFFEPIKNAEFNKYLAFIFLFHLFLTTSSSFTSLYLIRYLSFDYGFISTINVLSYIAMILGTRIWDRFQNKYGNVFVMKYSAFFVIGEYFIYFFLTERTYFLLYLSSLVGGIGNGGFLIAIMAYRFEIMPERAKTIYEGWYKAVYGLSVLIAPTIGELLMKILPDFSTHIFPVSKFQLLYLISFIAAGFVIFFIFIKPGFIRNKIANQIGNTLKIALNNERSVNR